MAVLGPKVNVGPHLRQSGLHCLLRALGPARPPTLAIVGGHPTIKGPPGVSCKKGVENANANAQNWHVS